MAEHELDRRGFVKGTIGAAVAAGMGRAEANRPARAASPAKKPSAGTRPIRLGAPIFIKTDDPEELAREHHRLGYRAAYCPPVSIDDAKRIRDISTAYARHDVVIAEVGRWVNLRDADPAKRAKHVEIVTKGLALAEAIGALCCVDIAGSYSKEQWFGPHPDNLSPRFFDETVETARTIIDAVKPKRAKFCLEMMGWALPDSPDAYLKLLEAIDRPAFAVHFDPCNLVNSPRRFYRNGALIDECFDKLGRWIVSCHAKDLTWDVEMNIHFREVPPGSGKLDYTTYLKRLAKLDHDAPLMIEHCANAAEYDKARKHLFGLGPKVGVSFE